MLALFQLRHRDRRLDWRNDTVEHVIIIQRSSTFYIRSTQRIKK